MIAKTKKQKPTRDIATESETNSARRKGGERSLATEHKDAALETTPADTTNGTAVYVGGNAGDETHRANGTRSVARKTKPAGGMCATVKTHGGKRRTVNAKKPIAPLSGRTRRRRGVRSPDDDKLCASPAETNGHANVLPTPIVEVHGPAGSGDEAPATDNFNAAACQQLMELQRRRVAALSSRNAIDNRLGALIAQQLGYRAGLDEAERKKFRPIADTIITAIRKGSVVAPEHEAIVAAYSGVVLSVGSGRDGFQHFIDETEKAMVKLAETLPAAKWIEQPDLRGFGLLSLAIVIGETGDLSNYANPAKVWKRLGCAPYKGKMPSTWRRGAEGKLSAEEWTEIGYSPRRRSIVFVIGENIVKLNKGPYRQRYDESKAAAKVNHPDWSDGRAHWHGMLLASKRLLKDLWVQWNRPAT